LSSFRLVTSRGALANLRGYWTEQLEKASSFHSNTKLRGAEPLGYTPERFFSTGHVFYPLLRPTMEELFDVIASNSGRSRPTITPAQVRPREGGEATQCSAFLGALLLDGKPGRSGGAVKGAIGRHASDSVHQSPRGGYRQGA